MAKTLTRKKNLKAVRAYQQREKDRAELMAMFSAAAPKGIGEHIRFSFEVEDGETRLVWDKDEVGAAFINEFAASLGLTGELVMRELSLHVGKKLIRREYDWQGEDRG